MNRCSRQGRQAAHKCRLLAQSALLREGLADELHQALRPWALVGHALTWLSAPAARAPLAWTLIGMLCRHLTRRRRDR